jgi:hypothetical protein
MQDNTRDLMQFGYVELAEAGRLLTTFKTHHDKTERLSSNVAVEFNPNSGNVFLVDEDYNVAMMNGHELVDFYSCPECGNEGFDGDYEFKTYQGYCSHECADKNT